MPEDNEFHLRFDRQEQAFINSLIYRGNFTVLDESQRFRSGCIKGFLPAKAVWGYQTACRTEHWFVIRERLKLKA